MTKLISTTLALVVPLFIYAQAWANIPTPEALQPKGKIALERASGHFNALMLFVDFADLPHELQQAGPSANNLLGEGRFRDFIYQQSQGRLLIDVAVQRGWRRMPYPIKAYKETLEGHFINNGTLIRFIQDVQRLFTDIDFSKYSIVYVVSPNSSVYRRSQAVSNHAMTTWLKEPYSKNFDRKIRNFISIGGSAQSQRRPYMSVAHETMHIFGLPDLYNNRPSRLSHIVWDLMDDPYRANGFIGWHHYALGWLRRSRIAIPPPRSSRQYTLSPIRSGSGTALILIPLNGQQNKKYLAIEIAEPATPLLLKEGTALQGAGVLTYTISLARNRSRWRIDLFPLPKAMPQDTKQSKAQYIPDAQHHFLIPSHQSGDSIHDSINRIHIRIGARTGSHYIVEVSRY